MVLDTIDPFGDERLDTHMAILATAIFGAAGATKPDKRPFTPDDFLPLFQTSDAKNLGPTNQDVNKEVRRIFGVPDVVSV